METEKNVWAMVMTFISFIHSFSFTVIYSFTCQLTHIFTLQAYVKKVLQAGSKKQVYEVEEGAAPFFSCPPLCSPFPHPWDQCMTLVALSKDVAYLLLPSLASIILPSLLSWSEPSSPSALDSSRECAGDSHPLIFLESIMHACKVTWVAYNSVQAFGL